MPPALQALRAMQSIVRAKRALHRQEEDALVARLIEVGGDYHRQRLMAVGDAGPPLPAVGAGAPPRSRFKGSDELQRLREREHAQRRAEQQQRSWDGSSARLVLTENLTRKLYLKLVMTVLANRVALRKLRDKLVAQARRVAEREILSICWIRIWEAGRPVRKLKALRHAMDRLLHVAAVRRWARFAAGRAGVRRAHDEAVRRREARTMHVVWGRMTALAALAQRQQRAADAFRDGWCRQRVRLALVCWRKRARATRDTRQLQDRATRDVVAPRARARAWRAWAGLWTALVYRRRMLAAKSLQGLWSNRCERQDTRALEQRADEHHMGVVARRALQGLWDYVEHRRERRMERGRADRVCRRRVLIAGFARWREAAALREDERSAAVYFGQSLLRKTLLHWCTFAAYRADMRAIEHEADRHRRRVLLGRAVADWREYAATSRRHRAILETHQERQRVRSLAIGLRALAANVEHQQVKRDAQARADGFVRQTRLAKGVAALRLYRAARMHKERQDAALLARWRRRMQRAVLGKLLGAASDARAEREGTAWADKHRSEVIVAQAWRQWRDWFAGERAARDKDARGQAWMRQRAMAKTLAILHHHAGHQRGERQRMALADAHRARYLQGQALRIWVAQIAHIWRYRSLAFVAAVHRRRVYLSLAMRGLQGQDGPGRATGLPKHDAALLLDAAVSFKSLASLLERNQLSGVQQRFVTRAVFSTVVTARTGMAALVDVPPPSPARTRKRAVRFSAQNSVRVFDALAESDTGAKRQRSEEDKVSDPAAVEAEEAIAADPDDEVAVLYARLEARTQQVYESRLAFRCLQAWRSWVQAVRLVRLQQERAVEEERMAARLQHRYQDSDHDQAFAAHEQHQQQVSRSSTRAWRRWEERAGAVEALSARRQRATMEAAFFAWFDFARARAISVERFRRHWRVSLPMARAFAVWRARTMHQRRTRDLHFAAEWHHCQQLKRRVLRQWSIRIRQRREHHSALGYAFAGWRRVASERAARLQVAYEHAVRRRLRGWLRQWAGRASALHHERLMETRADLFYASKLRGIGSARRVGLERLLAVVAENDDPPGPLGIAWSEIRYRLMLFALRGWRRFVAEHKIVQRLEHKASMLFDRRMLVRSFARWRARAACRRALAPPPQPPPVSRAVGLLPTTSEPRPERPAVRDVFLPLVSVVGAADEQVQEPAATYDLETRAGVAPLEAETVSQAPAHPTKTSLLAGETDAPSPPVYSARQLDLLPMPAAETHIEIVGAPALSQIDVVTTAPLPPPRNRTVARLIMDDDTSSVSIDSGSEASDCDSTDSQSSSRRVTWAKKAKVRMYSPPSPPSPVEARRRRRAARQARLSALAPLDMDSASTSSEGLSLLK